MKAFALVSIALVFAGYLPAFGQGSSYTYSYGSSRVVNQNQTGLYQPAATQIGAGTMSQTARGLQPGGAGMMSNPLLPRVNMGANIRTPGDAMYQGGGGQPQYQQAPVQYQGPVNSGLPAAHMGANIGTAGDNMRSDLRRPQQPQQRRYYYPQQPQQQQSTGIMYKPSSGGAATYAENTATGGGSRRF